MKLAWRQVAVAFLVGGVVGVGGAWWIVPRGVHRWEHGQPQARLLERFTRRLRLTAEQRAQVATILEATRQKIEALRAESRPRFEAIRNSTRAEIRQLLTPEQQQTFDVMDAEFERKMKRFRGHWDAPPEK